MWIETIVMPKEESRPAPRSSMRRDRSALHQSACEESQRFRDDVLSFLQTRGLLGAVKWISEPGSMPLVSLHCTASVLEQLRQAPHFEAGGSATSTVHA
jgi:hypothetical protein